MKEQELERLKNMMKYENLMYSQGYTTICGVDEAGRGPLCGPVVVGAVILAKDMYIEGVNDSKKLSPKKRDKLYDDITKNALAWSVGVSDVDVIEKVNILNATKLAMKQAIESLKLIPDYVLVDAVKNLKISIPYMSIIKGDALSQSIAAGSIIAKVTRDRMMIEYDKVYPQYNFLSNKGYGTKEHIDAIKKYGLCPIHRPSFCTHFINI